MTTPAAPISSRTGALFTTAGVWWHRLSPLVGLALFAVAILVLGGELRKMPPRELAATMRAMPGSALALAALLTFLNYLILTGYDQLAFVYIRRPIARWQIAMASFVGYAIANNVGFALHKLIDCAGRPFRPFNTPNPFLPMSQVLWADAIFVRDFTRLDAYSDDDLLKAAAILDVVYSSYDLVGLLLAEYDKRAKSSVRQAYVSDLQKRSSLSVRVLNIMDHPA